MAMDGLPAVIDPNRIDLRAIQGTTKAIRERLRKVDAALTVLQNTTGSNQLAATVAQLQQQVNLLQRRLTTVEGSLGANDTATLIALTDMPAGAPVVPSGATGCRMVDPNDPEAVFACVGLVTAAVAQGQAAVIQRRGSFSLPGSGFDAGREVYASIGGDLTQQPTYGAAAVPVGVATSADTIYLAPGGPALLALGLDDNAYERFMYASIEIVSDAIALASQVDAAANGLIVKTADDSVTSRVLQGTTNRVTVTNGDGVAGNPAVDISASYAGQSTITTLGTITTGVWQGTTLAVAAGGSGQVTANAALNAFLPTQSGHVGEALFTNGTNTAWGTVTLGTVTSVGVSGNNGIGVSGSPITNSGTITLSLGAITPTSVNASGTVAGSNLSGTNTGDQTITLTGDVTGSGTGSFAATLATVNSNVGSFGSSTAIPAFTVNAKGLITAASTNAVVAPAGTLTGTTLAANVVSSSLTSLGTIATGVWQGTVIGAAYGGTGIASYTVGDILYASGATTLSKLADVATGNALISGGVATAPSWGKIDLTAHISGTLPGANGGTGNGFFAVSGPATSLKTFTFPNASAAVLTDNAAVTVAQGGTGIASGTSGGIPYYSGTTTIASSAALTANRLVLGGGAGAAPTVLGSLGTTTTVLHGNAAGAPTFGAVSLTADVTGTLPVANGGTGVTALSSLTANPSASVGLSAVNGSASTFMRSDAAPALSQSISPTWTGNHTFAPASGDTLFSAGNVSINFATPSSKLTVKSTSNGQEIVTAASTSTTTFNAFNCSNLTDADLVIQVSGAGAATKFASIGAVSAIPINFRTSNADRATLDASGNFGVGTTSPASFGKLAVVGGAFDFSVNPGAGGTRTDVGQTASKALAIINNGGIQIFMDTSNNIGLRATSFGTSAAGVIGIANGTAPSTSPAGMGQMYVESGALKYRGSSGTVTTVAAA